MPITPGGFRSKGIEVAPAVRRDSGTAVTAELAAGAVAADAAGDHREFDASDGVDDANVAWFQIGI
ncbi:MAG: hypothetical protein JNM13_05805 [Hyphomicrobiaceae bacterium]|nr:hypothetical protein [Hyphomicrobiaceae bacterium]